MIDPTAWPPQQPVTPHTDDHLERLRQAEDDDVWQRAREQIEEMGGDPDKAGLPPTDTADADVDDADERA